MTVEPTNEELAKSYTNKIEQAQERRQEKNQERLERHGEAAAIAAQDPGFSNFSSQTVEIDGITSQQSKSLAKELNSDNEKGDSVKQAKAMEMAKRFREKAAQDRQAARTFSR